MRGVYLYSSFDLGTMREEFLFATNENYEPITFDFVDIIMKEEEVEN